MWEEHPAEMGSTLARHDSLMRAAIESNGGHVFKTVGDSFCAVFPDAPDALAACLHAQRSLQTEPWPETTPIRVRIALHTGGAEKRGDDYFGPSVNRVARLLSLAHGEQVLLSDVTQDLCRDLLPAGVTLKHLGEHALKDLGRPENVYQMVHEGLRSEFPVLRTGPRPSHPHNLPVQTTNFVGRDRELDEIADLLQRTRILTLTGAGGCGKTRLALEVGEAALAELPDGVWLAELASLADSALVAPALLEVLGLRAEPGRPTLDTLTDYLRPRNLLLILDNCEHLLDTCAEVCEALVRACPSVRILCTSREGLGIEGEQAYRVPSLRLPSRNEPATVASVSTCEAVRLFVDRATLQRPEFRITAENAADLAAICLRLDGIPLALELAAARVRSMSVEEICQRLDQRFKLLTGGRRTALPRQRTLQSLIDWSYDLLSPEEKTLLRRLSVFSGGWSLTAAEAVCSGDPIEPWEVLDLLSGLTDKSLLVVEFSTGATRYNMLETVRQYSQERMLEHGGGDFWRARHVAWCLALVETASQHLYRAGQTDWQQQLTADYDNIRSAMDWCLSSPELAESALRFVGALSQFWMMGSHQQEASTWIQGALTTGRNAPPSILVRVLEAGSFSYLDRGDYETAESLATEWVQCARRTIDQRQIAYALYGLGIVRIHRWEITGAEECVLEGLRVAEREEDPWFLGRFQCLHGILYWMRKDCPQARILLEAAVRHSQEVEDDWHLGMALFNLASVTRCDGAYDIARERNAEGLAIFLRLGDRRGLAYHLAGCAANAVGQGNAERAATLLGAANSLVERVGSHFTPVTQKENDDTRDRAIGLLGCETFEGLYQDGHEMTVEQAADFADAG